MTEVTACILVVLFLALCRLDKVGAVAALVAPLIFNVRRIDTTRQKSVFDEHLLARGRCSAVKMGNTPGSSSPAAGLHCVFGQGFILAHKHSDGAYTLYLTGTKADHALSSLLHGVPEGIRVVSGAPGGADPFEAARILPHRAPERWIADFCKEVVDDYVVAEQAAGILITPAGHRQASEVGLAMALSLRHRTRFDNPTCEPVVLDGVQLSALPAAPPSPEPTRERPLIVVLTDYDRLLDAEDTLEGAATAANEALMRLQEKPWTIVIAQVDHEAEDKHFFKRAATSPRLC